MTETFFEKPKEGEPWEVVVIGSGPAGITASIYTTRGAASTLLIAGTVWGGQLMLTTDVDNYPGFPEGIQGPELMQNMRKQTERFGTEIVEADVVNVVLNAKPFKVETSKGEYLAKSIIIASGAQTRWLGVPGEEKLRGRGVSSCAPCDAPFFKDKKVIVVGGGDSAMEEALVLTKYASLVTIIHRRDQFKASQAMQQKVLGHEKIKVIWNAQVSEFLGEKKLEKVLLKKTDGSTEEVETDGAFVAIGHTPATAIFSDKIELGEKGYIEKQKQDGFSMATSVPGVFVAGDVHDYHYRQAITAAAFGCMAALDVLKYLDKEAPNW